VSAFHQFLQLLLDQTLQHFPGQNASVARAITGIGNVLRPQVRQLQSPLRLSSRALLQRPDFTVDTAIDGNPCLYRPMLLEREC